MIANRNKELVDRLIKVLRDHDITGYAGEDFEIDLKVLIEQVEDVEFDIDKINDETLIFPEISGVEEYTSIKVRDFLDIFESIESAKINDSQSYACNEYEAYFLLEFPDYDTYTFLQGIVEKNSDIVNIENTTSKFWEMDYLIDGVEYNISLFNGLCLYHFLVEKSGNFDKYYPSFNDDFFIRIASNSEINLEVCDKLAMSYMFEIQSTLGLALEFSAGRAEIFEFSGDDTKTISEGSNRIFPLLYGKGINELQKIYYKAKTSDDLDYRILNYTQILEYIAPTIAQFDLHETIRTKLLSNVVLNPTAEYINELGKIYKIYQDTVVKDSDLIKLAIEKVIDFDSVWSELAPIIKIKNAPFNEGNLSNYINSTSKVVYDTRNEIAHAKANYAKTGNECPEKLKEQFCRVLDKFAVTSIRWFATQQEEKRVILSYIK
ncbi:TPA: hypothetical protein TT553_001029 [Streptococcus equi subsp. zooepidemicus]|nr:hypothetical protein [Streptococcus equi subsp. zooepidemicus]